MLNELLVERPLALKAYCPSQSKHRQKSGSERQALLRSVLVVDVQCALPRNDIDYPKLSWVCVAPALIFQRLCADRIFVKDFEATVIVLSQHVQSDRLGLSFLVFFGGHIDLVVINLSTQLFSFQDRIQHHIPRFVTDPGCDLDRAYGPVNDEYWPILFMNII